MTVGGAAANAAPDDGAAARRAKETSMRLLGTLGLGLLVASLSACADRGTDTARQAAATATPPPPEPAAAAGTRAPIDALPILGKDTALVTVIEFTDYECPYCMRADKTMAALAARYGDDLRFAVAMHPLPFHERARPAALAALAAAAQGKLAAMHARLFADGRSLDEAGLVRAATEAGLDLALFDAARAAPETAAALDRAEALAQTLGVKGTPSFVIDGRRVVGAQPIETFVTIVEQELARARTLLAAGTRREDLYGKLLETVPPPSPEPSGAGGGNCEDGECHGAPPEPGDVAPVAVAID
ncbi:MAG TPA: DsbA family protein, partial [Polyangiaceae bacterium]